MINDPITGNRLPTAQEVIDNVRRERLSAYIKTDRYSVKNIRQPDTGINGRSEQTSEQGPGPTFPDDTGIRVTESGTRSNVSTNDESGWSDGTVRRGNDSSNRSNESTTTDNESSATSAYYPLKRSKFTPYKEAVKQAFTKKSGTKKEKAASEPKIITDSEAKVLRGKLIETILWQSEHLDQLIIATTKGHDYTIVIWADLDENDAGTLADFLIARAKTDRRTARLVREMVDFMEKIKLGLIVGPRIYKTMMAYIERGFSIRY